MFDIENPKQPEKKDDITEIVTPLVGLPEFLKKESLDGLMPDTAAFLYPSSLVFDHRTGGLYLDTTTELSDDSFEWPGYQKDKSGRIAVMHVYDETGSHFVVDATGLQPGQIQSEKDLFDEGTPEERRFTSATRSNRLPLAAVVFKNLEGEIEVHGDPLYFDSAKKVVEEFDDVITESNGELSSEHSSDDTDDDYSNDASTLDLDVDPSKSIE